MVKRLSSVERRAELREFLDGVGVLNINKCELAKKFLVSEKVIRNDIKLIMSDSKPEDVGLLFRKFDAAFNVALYKALKSLSMASGSKETNDSIRTLALVVHEYLGSLSRLGYPVGESGQPVNVKPSVEQFNAFLELRYKKSKKTEGKIPVDYSSLDYRPPGARHQEITSPPAQDSPTDEDVDDLEELTPEELRELEEDDDECQK